MAQHRIPAYSGKTSEQLYHALLDRDATILRLQGQIAALQSIAVSAMQVQAGVAVAPATEPVAPATEPATEPVNKRQINVPEGNPDAFFQEYQGRLYLHLKAFPKAWLSSDGKTVDETELFERKLSYNRAQRPAKSVGYPLTVRIMASDSQRKSVIEQIAPEVGIKIN